MATVALFLIPVWSLQAAEPAASGDTNDFDLVLTTNYIRTVESFRRVDGRLYNIEKSRAWELIRGEVEAVTTNGLIVRRIITYVSPPVRAGEPSSTRDGLGPRMLVKHLPEAMWRKPDSFTLEDTFAAMAMKTAAIYRYGDQRLEVWDCGTVNTVPVVFTNIVLRATAEVPGSITSAPLTAIPPPRAPAAFGSESPAYEPSFTSFKTEFKEDFKWWWTHKAALASFILFLCSLLNIYVPVAVAERGLPKLTLAGLTREFPRLRWLKWGSSLWVLGSILFAVALYPLYYLMDQPRRLGDDQGVFLIAAVFCVLPLFHGVLALVTGVYRGMGRNGLLDEYYCVARTRLAWVPWAHVLVTLIIAGASLAGFFATERH